MGDIGNLLSNISFGLMEGTAYLLSALPIVALFLSYVVELMQKGKIVMPTISETRGSSYKKYSRLSFKIDHSIMVSFIFIAYIIFSILLLYVNAKCERYIYALMENGSIECFCTISLGFTTMMFAMAFVLMLREKKYYLVFSVTDVLERYDFFLQLEFLFISCLGVCLAVVCLLDGHLETYFDLIIFIALELSFGTNVLCLCLCFYNISKIMFSSEKGELHLLDKLYQIFDMAYLDISNVKAKWDDMDIIRTHIAYLYENYIQSYKSIKREKIRKVICISYFEDKDDPTDLIKAAKRKYVCVIGSMLLVWLMMRITNNFGTTQKVGVIIQIIIFFLDFFIIFIPCKTLNILLFNIFGDYYGYEFYDSKGKGKVVSEFQYTICKRKYLRYVRCMNSFIAFIYIAKIRDVDIKKLNSILKEYVMMEKKDTQSTAELLPFWVIGYLIKEKNEDEMIYLKEAYKDMDLNKEQKADFRKMVGSQIKYINRKRNSGYDLDGTEYLKWLYE